MQEIVVCTEDAAHRVDESASNGSKNSLSAISGRKQSWNKSYLPPSVQIVLVIVL